MDQIEILQLTHSAVQFLYKEATPLLAKDFVGYITKYSTHSNIGIGVDLLGNVSIFSLTAVPLSLRKIKRVIKKLIKNHFLEISIEPFPEFSERFNLKFDLFKAIVVEGPYFERQK